MFRVGNQTVTHRDGNSNTFQLVIDSVDTRSANPAASMLRKMAAKDGFDENVRMEMHEDAEKSTYSVDGDADSDVTGEELGADMPDDQPASPAQQGTSQVSNRTIEIQGFSPLPPRMVSTPDEVPVSQMERTKNEILDNLNQVQELCENTMKEVRSLQSKCSKTELDTNTLKVLYSNINSPIP